MKRDLNVIALKGQEQHCSFCGRHEDLLTGCLIVTGALRVNESYYTPSGKEVILDFDYAPAICEDCVSSCNDIIAKQKGGYNAPALENKE